MCTKNSEIQGLLDSLCAPVGSLGLLGELAVKALSARFDGKITDGKITEYHFVNALHTVYASNNGIVEEGVSGYPEDVTEIQYYNMLDLRRAVISKFCQSARICLKVADVGIRPGTKNFLKEPAMTHRQFDVCMLEGVRRVRHSLDDGYNLLSFGELGIGNTTTSSAVLYALCKVFKTYNEVEIKDVVSGGATPNNADVIDNKSRVVCEAYNKYISGREFKRTSAENIVEYILTNMGGFDLVCMTMSMLECSRLGIPFVVDGFISSVALACACIIDIRVRNYAIPSHLSKESGMKIALFMAGIHSSKVPLNYNMALGEGTGAVLMIPHLKMAITAIQECISLQGLTEKYESRHSYLK